MTRYITIIFIILVLLIFGVAGLKLIKKANIKNQPVELVEIVDTKKEIEVPEVAPDETEAIEDWIIKNNLNQYGDPINFAYTGGSPLFNEQTGQTMDRYDYILQNHPDKP